jgi:hypothetical protein
VVVSDSARVLAELQFAARDRLAVAHCCSQPVHVAEASSSEGSFFTQEAVDLFLLAMSGRVVGNLGGFSLLGRYWMGRKGTTEMSFVYRREEVQAELNAVLDDCGCQRG